MAYQQDPNLSGLHLGAPLNASSNTQVDQREYQTGAGSHASYETTQRAADPHLHYSQQQTAVAAVPVAVVGQEQHREHRTERREPQLEDEHGHNHQHRGHHQPGNPHPENIDATTPIKPDGKLSDRDVTIAGFNPKDTHNIESRPAPPQEVERISTDGPHGLVWVASEKKYYHRRELTESQLKELERGHASSSRHREEERFVQAGPPVAVPVSAVQQGVREEHVERREVPVREERHEYRETPTRHEERYKETVKPVHREERHETRAVPVAAAVPVQREEHRRHEEPKREEYHPDTSRAHNVGVSPEGTESHNSNTSRLDSRPTGEQGINAKPKAGGPSLGY